MKKAVSIVTLFDILFLLILSASAALGGAFGLVFRFVGVGATLFVSYRISLRFKREREEVAGISEEGFNPLLINKDGLSFFLPLVIPSVAVIFLVSFVTSLLLSLTGMQSTPVPEASFLEMALINCLIPTVLEEAVFRYVPMILIAPYSKRWCIIISSLFFALAHLDAFQIPYALVAGIILISVNLATNSIIPSLVIHFLNNLVSVVWIKYCTEPTSVIVFVATLTVLALVCLIPVFLRRGSYRERLMPLFSSGERLDSSYPVVIYVLFTVALMAYNIFVQ